MRIISGLYKSRKIIAPKNLPVRPTTDMAKESLFNIINNLYYFDEISVLDLFAGTGNISYEFASRGTEQITCVDQNFGCVKFINQTAEKFEMPIQTIKSDVFKFLEKTTIKANIIFADPPYNFDDNQFSKIPELVFQNDLLLDGGILIVEHSKHTNLSNIENYAYSKNYGGNVFSFFEKS
ncbi:16S rRNA (guanine(966)-N(2))-methyltransferase RsmD [uncultured Algibacter sp.]|uniref:16S rRNA (guanine(966)-N(2))-methyltransferase RsmD n=1 Tax=uncultured Algibacter sp. TaxID=298659 RepID=UPI00260F953D|nr:16S rRNA (guanine(966)-N(2))-methyltransferase RsmD [uncultured Algibacter sp.]